MSTFACESRRHRIKSVQTIEPPPSPPPVSVIKSNEKHIAIDCVPAMKFGVKLFRILRIGGVGDLGACAKYNLLLNI